VKHSVSRVLSWSGHLSEDRLAAFFSRPYPGVGGQRHPPLFGLAPDGVYLARKSLSARWALTPPFHPCLDEAVYFCGTFLWFAPTGNCPASCPSEPGLSSLLKKSGHLEYFDLIISLQDRKKTPQERTASRRKNEEPLLNGSSASC